MTKVGRFRDWMFGEMEEMRREMEQVAPQ
jgi:hypothetical protein